MAEHVGEHLNRNYVPIIHTYTYTLQYLHFDNINENLCIKILSIGDRMSYIAYYFIF